MIDAATKQKIIDLYNEGKTKTEIHKITKISEPSIRVIIKDYQTKIREQKLNGEKYNENNTDKLLELENRIIKLEQTKEKQTEAEDKMMESQINKFIINTTVNSPYGKNKPYQMLRNGVPIFDLSRVLEIILPRSIVNELMNKIEKTGITEGLFEVTVIEKSDGIISTSVRVLQEK